MKKNKWIDFFEQNNNSRTFGYGCLVGVVIFISYVVIVLLL